MNIIIRFVWDFICPQRRFIDDKNFKNSKNLKKYINLLHITKLGDAEDASTTLAPVNWGILNIL